MDTLLLEALPHLRAYARSLTGNAVDADDLVQDTSVRLLAAYEQYVEGTNFRAWAIAALRNRFIDLRRRARFHGGSIEDINTTLLATPAGQEHVVRYREVLRQIPRLPEQMSTVIILIAFGGMSYEDVAKLLKCPIGTIRSRLARARKYLEDGESRDPLLDELFDEETFLGSSEKEYAV